MSLSTWAEKEIEIACAKEREASEDPDGWDYGCACYESALKAFRSLLEDEHSGYSIGVTKNILVRLIEGKPLTPIEDTPDVWSGINWTGKNGEKVYQCSRMHSLFKTVHRDGTVTYRDADRVRCTYTANSNVFYTSLQARNLIDEMFPITMPYWPRGKGYTLYGENFLLDSANGDFDTTGYFYAIDPDGQRIEINRYFAEKDREFVEIDFEEYCERKKAAHDLDNVKGDE